MSQVAQTLAAAYSGAIDLLASDNIDYKRIAINLAKQNPVLFLKMAGHIPLDDVPDDVGITDDDDQWEQKFHDFVVNQDYSEAANTLLRSCSSHLADYGDKFRCVHDIIEKYEHNLSAMGIIPPADIVLDLSPLDYTCESILVHLISTNLM